MVAVVRGAIRGGETTGSGRAGAVMTTACFSPWTHSMGHIVRNTQYAFDLPYAHVLVVRSTPSAWQTTPTSTRPVPFFFFFFPLSRSRRALYTSIRFSGSGVFIPYPYMYIHSVICNTVRTILNHTPGTAHTRMSTPGIITSLRGCQTSVPPITFPTETNTRTNVHHLERVRVHLSITQNSCSIV